MSDLYSAAMSSLEADLAKALKLKDPAYRAKTIRAELIPRGQRLAAELAKAQAEAVREWYELGEKSMRDIAADLGVTMGAVQQMLAISGGAPIPPSLRRVSNDQRIASLDDDKSKYGRRYK